MKTTDHIKRAAFEKAVDYFLTDPEHNIVKIMDLIDKVAPKDLFASQRTAFRGAIDDQSNWYRLIMHIMNDTNPEVRDDLVKTLIIEDATKPSASPSHLGTWPTHDHGEDSAKQTERKPTRLCHKGKRIGQLRFRRRIRSCCLLLQSLLASVRIRYVYFALIMLSLLHHEHIPLDCAQKTR